jgi:WD40 repeat protein
MNYIVTTNYGYAQSYDYNNNKMYKRYNAKDYSKHHSMIVYKKEDIVKLIDSSYDGNIRIWDFHMGKLLNIIKVNDEELFNICLWNNEYLFVGCRNFKNFEKNKESGTIKLVNIEKGHILNSLNECNYGVFIIKKFYHPKYGECLISLGDDLKLWRIKSNND